MHHADPRAILAAPSSAIVRSAARPITAAFAEQIAAWYLVDRTSCGLGSATTASMLDTYRGRWRLWLPATFAAVALSFIVGTVLAQWKLLATDRASTAIAEDAAPSVERLSTASIDLRHLQAVLERDLDTVEHDGASDPAPIMRIRSHLEQELDEYLNVPFFDAERSLWNDVADQKRTLDQSLDRYASAVASGNVDEARTTLRDDITPKIDDLTVALSRSVRLNASRAHDLALEIKRFRRDAMREAYALNAVSTLIAVGGVLLLRSIVRAHARLLERNAQLERDRASELEQFAGRVAHDILSPLNTAASALELVPLEQDARRKKEIAARGSGALQRVRRLVDGLLDFARAGASPDPTACADVAATIDDVLADVRPSALEAGIDLEIERHDVGMVRCHPGVLTSLISNLARNAIKYIGDGLVRRIEISTFDRGDHVRVEVSDTGPGLAPDIEARIFEPYARGHSDQPGIGLGLATVKRLAESHGGSVGVKSVPGKGCQFWFELPKAMSPVGEPAIAPA